MGIRFAILVLITFSAACMHRASAHVALDYPVGGEVFIQGQSITIEWHITAFHNTLNWDLFFSADGGDTWVPILLNIHVDTLSYEWEVPFIETVQGRIRVIQDNSAQDYLDFSMDFSIVPNTSPPMLDAPANDITVTCNTATQQNAIQAWLNSNGGASATNYCSDLLWTNDYFGLNNGCGATGSTVVTFQATDECGSTVTIASITVADITPPNMIALPASITVTCDGQGNLNQLNQWLFNRGGAQATDACGNVIWSNNYAALSNECGASGTAIVTFTATDECDNITTAAASFTITDIIAPQVTRIARDTVITCGAANQDGLIQHWLNRNGGAEAIDACGDVSWSNNYVGMNDGCGASGNATVIFSATDACGNSTTSSATISLEDKVAPVIHQAARDTTMACSSSNQDSIIQQWLVAHGGANATDLCGSVSWDHTYAGLSDSCSFTGGAVVIFTATDECGNSSSTHATIAVEDRTPPVIEQPALDMTIHCDAPGYQAILQAWLIDQAGASAIDQCGDVSWTNNLVLPGESCEAGIHTVSFIASDDCLNSSTTVAILTILDTTTTLIGNYPDADFAIYPNPVRDVLTIDFNSGESLPLQVMLADIHGREWWSTQPLSQIINLPVTQYPAGLYVVSIKTRMGTYVKMVMIE